MTEPTQNTEQMLKRLESLTAHPPPERTRPEIEKTLDAIITECKSSPGSAHDVLSRAALTLYARAAAGDDPELTAYYISQLPPLGALAAPLALLLFCKRDEEAEPLKEFPPDLPVFFRLSMANHQLLSTQALLRPLRAAALATCRELDSLSNSDITSWLTELADHDIPCAYPLRHTLLNGAYGKHLRECIEAMTDRLRQSKRPGPELQECCAPLLLLPEETLSNSLLPLLASKDYLAQHTLLRATMQTGRRFDKNIGRTLLHSLAFPDPRIRRAALDCYVRLLPTETGRIFAGMFRKEKTLRADILARIPLLNAYEAQQFLTSAGIAPERIHAAIFIRLAHLAPYGARHALKSAAVPKDSPLWKIIPETEPTDQFDAQKVIQSFTPQDDKPKTPEKKKGKGLLGGLFGSDSEEAISIQFGSDMVLDSEYSGKRISPIYEARTLRGAKFTKALIENATFEGCTFIDCDFSHSILTSTRFTGCTFRNCTFDHTRFFDCDLFDLDVTGARADKNIYSDCHIALVSVTASRLCGMTLHKSRLETTRFTACDLSEACFKGTLIGGTEFHHSMARDMSVSGCTFLCTTVTATALTGGCFEGISCGNVELMTKQEEYRLTRASELTDLPPKIPGATPQTGGEVVSAIQHWFQLRDIQLNALAFLTNNARRTSWACEKLGAEKTDFYRLAPYLLHTETFERWHEDLDPLPLSCRVANYFPDYSTIEIAREHLPGATLPQPAPDPIHLAALYTIGSVGTVAQTAASDLDYWVCYEAEDMPEFLVDSLTYKMEAIEKWADDVFGLEVHFFTMDVNLIRSNTFGASDAESSGTAQALLLKEEFYRTAVYCAGRIPVWWTTGTKADDSTYDSVTKMLDTVPWGRSFIDLGNLVEIPPEEFFGASLWQIVKALKSPFKSIMKFGLLEKYIAAGEGGSPLLCERLKSNILRGQLTLHYADPYMLLFKEVLEHYTRTGENDSIKLVRLSFFLKTKLAKQNGIRLPMRQEEYEAARLLHALPQGMENGTDWPFQKLVTIGSLVNRFIVRTYMRVRDSQKGASIAISPEDITKLGRKIFSTFSHRKNKIEHLPFLAVGGTKFRVLHFSATGKKIGQPKHWNVQGAQEVADAQRLDLVDLRKGTDLAEHIVWLTSNGIYKPGMRIMGDYSISPVTARDIQNLMDRLLEFFPAKETFNTDIAEMLQPERVVRAFFILNLTKLPETANITEASVIYSTNWGELFCRTVPVEGTELLENPVQFLLNNIEQEFTSPPVMDSFAPDRSICPRPSL